MITMYSITLFFMSSIFMYNRIIGYKKSIIFEATTYLYIIIFTICINCFSYLTFTENVNLFLLIENWVQLIILAMLFLLIGNMLDKKRQLKLYLKAKLNTENQEYISDDLKKNNDDNEELKEIIQKQKKDIDLLKSELMKIRQFVKNQHKVNSGNDLKINSTVVRLKEALKTVDVIVSKNKKDKST